MAGKVVVAPRADETFDIDAVIRRRLEGEPFGARDTTVPLKDGAKWATYEANSMADRNMHYRMVHQLGWLPVRVEDLADGITPESIGWQVDAGGVLCRGPQQDQKLYKQPVDVRHRIAQAKAAANLKGIGSAKAVKDSMVAAASAQLGDEAATFTNGLTVTGSDRRG